MKEMAISEFETARCLDGKLVVLLDPQFETAQDDVLFHLIRLFMLRAAIEKQPQPGKTIRFRFRFRQTLNSG